MLLYGKEDARNKVCQRFADTGAGFGYQVLLVLKGASDGSGHLLLLRAHLEVFRFGQQAGGGKDCLHSLSKIGGNSFTQGNHGSRQFTRLR